ncbi:MAG: class I SAM-dependent methyltransferase [Candidatus Bathyarchaeota archaeon]|nr:class I SAM-dependent methyltransferase [Candidatus Bathyarchaeota archaeon]
MSSQLKRVHFGPCRFDVDEEVYEPAEDSFLFAENLHVNAGAEVLDVGTGSGILAVTAAKQGAHVTAVDVNPYAIHRAKANAELNLVDAAVSFIRSDLFSALSLAAKFDWVLFNAPYLPSLEDEEESWLARSWAGGADGRLVVDRFISLVPAYLNVDGRVLLMQSTLTGLEATLRGFADQNLRAHVVSSLPLPFFETLTLIEAQR